jgi:hypothetical protein
VTGDLVVAIVEKLAAALRADAAGLESPAAHQTVAALARDADAAVHSRARGKLLSVLTRAVEYSRLLGTGMAETHKVLNQFGHVIDTLH